MMTSVTHHQSKDNRGATPVVSVIIPSYNSPTYIRQCLSSLRAQTTALPFEVILVDSSDDGTNHIVANEFPEVRLFHFQERCFVGTARNIGIKQARGEVVLFLDTDCIAKHTWIDQMYSAIITLHADGVGGSVENGTPWSVTGTLGFYLEFFRLIAYQGEPYPTIFIIGGNSAFKRDVFRSIHYHDMNVGDDFTFTWQLAKQRKRLLFLPSVSIRHMNKTGLAKVFRYQYQLGIGAYSYRRQLSPNIIRHLNRFPILTFCIPVPMLGWIGYTLFRRRGVAELVRFFLLLPLLLIGNSVWATGFYRTLKEAKRAYAKKHALEFNTEKSTDHDLRSPLTSPAESHIPLTPAADRQSQDTQIS